MRLLLLISSLLLFSLFDFFAWKYKDSGKIVYSELYKICALLFVGSMFWLWAYEFKARYIIVWIFLHYPIHQVLQGTLRMKKPLYLGQGVFDKVIYFLTGGAWWMYLLSLLISAFVGIHIYLNT